LGDRPDLAQRVASTVDDLDETIKDIRRSIFALSVASGSTDIRSTTLQLVERVSQALKFRPDVRFVGPVNSRIGPETANHLLAVLGEALSNIVRHADATRVEVLLEAGDAVTLRVTDDGKGISPDAPRSGLRNMAERAEALGGTCSVESEPGQGTSVTWRVPAG
jgi:signal transduction histidine kinase